MVIDTYTKTIKDVLYPNNSKVVYPLPSMLDRPEAVCAVSIPQQNVFFFLVEFRKLFLTMTSHPRRDFYTHTHTHTHTPYPLKCNVLCTKSVYFILSQLLIHFLIYWSTFSTIGPLSHIVLVLAHFISCAVIS